MSQAIQSQIDQGAVPNHVSNVCPKGTKMWVLEVGWLEADEGFVIRGGNTSLKSTEDKPFVNKRRQLPMYCILIEHPVEGLILWETGCGKDYPTVVLMKLQEFKEQCANPCLPHRSGDRKYQISSPGLDMSRNTN